MPRRGVAAGIRATSAGLSVMAAPGWCLPWTGQASDCPDGWLLCYGQAVSRSEYQNLFRYYEMQGFPYGPGDGSTTFNVPDLRGRQFFGKDDLGGVAAGRVTLAECGIAGSTLGASGGLEVVALVNNQCPRHTHTVDNVDVNHTHTSPSGLWTRLGGIVEYAPDHVYFGVTAGVDYFMGYANMDHTHSITSVGGGLSHNNMAPSIILNWIVKV